MDQGPLFQAGDRHQIIAYSVDDEDYAGDEPKASMENGMLSPIDFENRQRILKAQGV